MRTDRYPLRPLAAIALMALAACGGEVLVAIPNLEVQGAAIDGSEDPREPEPVAATGSSPTPSRGADSEAPTEEGAPEESIDGVVEEAAAEVTAGAAEAVAAGPESATEEPAPRPERQSKWVDHEGTIDLTWADLSLIDYDVDAMLDYMLFPEEYEGEDTSFLELPADLEILDGKEVSIVGYMIPGEIIKGNVRDFMLVRDLMGCCFGGAPMPDEWLDVTMDPDAEAEYRPYMPMRVTGVMTLGGEQDEAGFALGIYRMTGDDVQVED